VESRDWLLPSGFSAIDTNVGYGIHIARRFVPADLLPAVDAYWKRLSARPAFLKAAAEDGEAEIYRRDFYEAPDG